MDGLNGAGIRLENIRTLMYRQVAAITEHDRIAVFPFSVVTYGTGGIL